MYLATVAEDTARLTRLFPPGASLSFLDEMRAMLQHVMLGPLLTLYTQRETGGTRALLEDQRYDALAIVYTCFAQSDSSLAALASHFQDYVVRCFKDFLFDKELNEAAPMVLIERVVAVRAMCVSLTRACNDNAVIEVAVYKAMSTQLNLNDRFPEYLSLYVDRALRAMAPGKENAFESLCSDVIYLYRMLSERDVFDTYASMHIARRLLSARNPDAEPSERYFINLLKVTSRSTANCYKMEKMVIEMAGGEEVMDAYKESLRPEGMIDLHVTVLTTGVWPILSRSPSLHLPNFVADGQRHFASFYKKRFHGRLLTYNYWLGSCDVRMYDATRKYELNVMTTQMALLMLFNDAESLSVDELALKSGMTAKDVKASLAPLIKNQPTHSKLMCLESGTEVLSLNPNFKSKHVKIRIANVVMRESDEQNKMTREKLGEERKWVLDATIVRLMKSRRQMEHRDILIEVTTMLRTTFTPSPELFLSIPS